MAVHFSRGRLHVGFRGEDWQWVWMLKPDSEEDDDDDDEDLDTEGQKKKKKKKKKKEGLKFVTIIGGQKEVMEGEILWHQPFDIALCRAKDIKTRKSLQSETLLSAYEYLGEKDPAKIKYMENIWNLPHSPRWHMWFELAKKHKKQTMQASAYRRNRRVDKAMKKGASRTQAEKRADEHDSDSAYESDDDSDYASDDQRRPAMQMTPPSTQNRKRKRQNGTNGDMGPPPSLGRWSNILATSRRGQPSRNFTMSGGAGSPSILNGQDDASEPDLDMDTRNPNQTGTSTPVTRNEGTWNFRPLGDPDAQRTRGRSVDTPSLNDFPRGINGHSQGSYQGSHNGLGSHGRLSDSLARPIENDSDSEGRNLINNANGAGMSEEEAVARAMRASLAPSDHGQNVNGYDLSEEDAFEQARRASLNDGTPKIEDDDDDAAGDENMEDQ